ncbi:glycoside hydrolase, partial [Corynespora cassiicola Philippines]
MIVYLLILLLQTVLLDAASIHTGFCVGAFWGTAQTPKTKADFLRQFTLAKNLPNVPVSFNSVRLFTSQQHNTKGTPSEAFEAAIETNTTLLLGFWASAFEYEKVALGAAFAKHGKKLADLVVGISVGNEDILRNQPDCKQAPDNKPCVEGQSPENIKKMIRETEIWLKQDFSDLFEERLPVGHTDTAAFAILDHVDYNGATIYPYWHGDKVEDANQSFFQTLDDLASRSGEIPVWITETGWPYAGPNSMAAIANSKNAQEYWKTVGCSIFGKYNTWWFQLESDSTDGPDWGIIDAQTQKPRFDLSC